MNIEPKLSDAIYVEIGECEEYALLNLITYEAAIRNPRVKEILSLLDNVFAEEKLDAMLEGDDRYSTLQKELKEEFWFDYDEYVKFTTQAKGDYIIHTNHNNSSAHKHWINLPLHRPKMAIPQKESYVSIEIPMYHIHPKDIKAYFGRLLEKYNEATEEAKEYYVGEELFYDTVDETKNKATTYAEKFFVWDYIEYWKNENGVFTPDATARGVYAEIAEQIGAEVNDRTGRSAKVEKHLEDMTKLIEKSEYKKYYTPK